MSNDEQIKYSREKPYHDQMPSSDYEHAIQIPTTQNFGQSPLTAPTQNIGNVPSPPLTHDFRPMHQGTKIPDNSRPPKRPNIWKTTTLIFFITTVLFIGSTILTYNGIISNPNIQKSTSTPNPTQIGQVSPTVPVPKTATAQPTLSPTTTTTTQPPTSSPDNYLATQPGPTCDKNGGTWTPNSSISGIQCGTSITIGANQARGYLSLTLPDNKAFVSNNKISVTSTVGYDTNSNLLNCAGLAEQDANSGYLVEYCNNGAWFIYSISNTGAIVDTLDKSITSIRHQEQLGLTLKGTELTFSIDTETHNFTISPIKPTSVSITAYCAYANYGITTTNFSYTVLKA